MIIFSCKRHLILVTFAVWILSFFSRSRTLSLNSFQFMMSMDEKRGVLPVEPVTAADSLVDFAGSRVLRHLTGPLKLPWETNPVLNPKRALRHAEPSLGQSVVGMRDFAMNVGIEGGSMEVATAPVLTRTLKRARLAASVTSPDELRLRALALIQIMVESDRTAKRLAQQVGIGHAGPTPLGPSLRDACAGKATATIYKRAQSLWGMFSWTRLVLGKTGLQIDESNLYAYLCSMRDEGRGATSGEAVLQAVRFFHSTLGFVGFNPATDISARVAGVAKQMFQTKRLLKQARALYVLELKALEDAVLEEKQPHVIAIAGYLLFCAMAVCRFSDPMFCTGLQVNRFRNTVLIEAGTSVHKT